LQPAPSCRVVWRRNEHDGAGVRVLDYRTLHGESE
jgi:hypothetical protein